MEIIYSYIAWCAIKITKYARTIKSMRYFEYINAADDKVKKKIEHD